MRTRDSIHRKNSPFYGPERFTYQPQSNSYRCPVGEQLNHVGLNVRNRAHAYIGSGQRCGACSQKAQCTSGRDKYLAIHMDETARQRARESVNTPEFAKARRERKKVEALFAEGAGAIANGNPAIRFLAGRSPIQDDGSPKKRRTTRFARFWTPSGRRNGTKCRAATSNDKDTIRTEKLPARHQVPPSKNEALA
jgi:hypothetical protein